MEESTTKYGCAGLTGAKEVAWGRQDGTATCPIMLENRAPCNIVTKGEGPKQLAAGSSKE